MIYTACYKLRILTLLRHFPCLILLVFSLIISGCTNSTDSKAKVEDRPKKRAIPVLTSLSAEKTIPVELQATGSVEPFASVAIKSMITGTLKIVHFKEGADIKKGDLLFTIDPRPFAAALSQIQAILARDKAEFTSAQKEFERYRQAAQKGYVSLEKADQAATKAANLQATLKADEAAVENARLQLEYCSIFAPIDGRAGALLVNEGNLIKANADTAMIAINQINPIKITFTVPGKHFGDIRKFQTEGVLKVFIPRPGGEQATGTLSFIDNNIDTATGTLRLKAEFNNDLKALWPGQFVDIRLLLTSRPNVVVVPTPAIQMGQKGPHIFVVKDDATVDDRSITTGGIIGGETVIETGLTAGERVVTDGQLQLTAGSKVEERSKSSPDKTKQPTEPSQEKPRATP